MLERAGLRCSLPRGAYYVMTDITGLGWSDDVAFVRHLVEDIGVAAVPGSSFYRAPARTPSPADAGASASASASATRRSPKPSAGWNGCERASAF